MNQRAFTLIEIMIALWLFATLLLSGSFPFISNARFEQKSAGQIEGIEALMRISSFLRNDLSAADHKTQVFTNEIRILGPDLMTTYKTSEQGFCREQGDTTDCLDRVLVSWVQIAGRIRFEMRLSDGNREPIILREVYPYVP